MSPPTSQLSAGIPLTIEAILSHSKKLSSAPQITCKLNRLLKDSSFLDDIVEVAQYDPGLTARILQICNTPAYRGRGEISSLKEAFARLGNEKIGRIIWQVAMSKQMSARLPAYRLGAGAIWRHSVTTAIAAEELWKLGRCDEDMATAFTAGLLHDIGKILIDRALSPNADLFRTYISENEIVAHEAEKTLLGFDHAEVGGKLLLQWGQSEALASAVAHHHAPANQKACRLAMLIKLANSCANHYERILQKETADKYPLVGTESLDALDINIPNLEKAMTAIQSRKAEVEVMLAVM